MGTNPLWHLRLRIHHQGVDALVAYLEGLHVDAISWLECDDAKPTMLKDSLGFPIAEEFLVEGYTTVKPDDRVFQNALDHLQLLQKLPIPPTYTISKVNSHEDWLTQCYKAMPAIQAGPFEIRGTHLLNDGKVTKNTLIVDAATAFGSGDHPTTKGCLTLLGKLARQHQFSNIMDMGCGSGILAIAAKKTWPKASVLAADYDAESVRVTERNAKLNLCSIQAIHSLGFQNAKTHPTEPFDLVLANILARPLVSIAPDVQKYTKTGSFVVLSGLLIKQMPLVLKAYSHQGFFLHHKYTEQEWATLCLKRV